MTTALDGLESTGTSPDEVLALLREEASLYAGLQANASRQRSLVTGEDMGPLLALLADRQRLSVELTRIGTKLAPTRRDWPTYRMSFTPTQRAEADRLVSDISDRLRRVIESDEEDARMLCARKQVVAQALQSTHTAGEALVAYQTPSTRRARIDQTDEA
jgi:hypothetical protein